MYIVYTNTCVRGGGCGVLGLRQNKHLQQSLFKGHPVVLSVEKCNDDHLCRLHSVLELLCPPSIRISEYSSWPQSRQCAKLFSIRRNWDSPTPLTRSRLYPPPPWFWAKGNTRWRERGWESPNTEAGTYTLYIFVLCEHDLLWGASKIKLKKVNKKRMVTVRRVIIFLNILRHPLLIWLHCCLHQYKTLKAVVTATVAIVVLTPAKNLNKVFWGVSSGLPLV